MKNLMIKTLPCILAGLICLPAQSALADEWEWTVAPYLWASSVGLDLSVNDRDLIGGEAEFKDLLDKVDSVFMGHFEGRNGRWGMYLDTIYLSLGESNTVTVGPGGPIQGDFTTDANMKMKLYDAGGLYRLNSPESDVRFDLLAGVRYIDVSIDALLTFPGPGDNEIDIDTGPSETDLMVGGRLAGNFSERWHWTVRGDLSFGGSEGTYNGVAAIGYTFGQSGLFSLDVGYRYMSIEMDGLTSGGRTASADITMSGPVVGFIFNF